MNSEHPKDDLPDDHGRLIAMMAVSTPPPEDGETPDIPEELLRRLEEHSKDSTASTIPTPLPSTTPEPKESSAPEKPVTIWTSTRRYLAIAATVALVGILTFTPKTGDAMRGGSRQSEQISVYWLSTTEPKPSGPGMPDLIVVDHVPTNAQGILLSPAAATASLLGQNTPPIPISDPTDPDEWLSAIRQLTRTQP